MNMLEESFKEWLERKSFLAVVVRVLAAILGPPILLGLYSQSVHIALACFLLQMYILILAEEFGFKHRLTGVTKRGDGHGTN